MPSNFRLEVRWDHSVGTSVRRDVEEGTRRTTEDLLQNANRNAPWMTGAMVRSSQVVELDPGHYRIEYRVPYAWRQHQGVRFRRPHGGRARWLADEMYSSDIERMIAARTRRF